MGRLANAYRPFFWVILLCWGRK